MIQSDKSQQLYKLNDRVSVVIKSVYKAPKVYQNDLIITVRTVEEKSPQFDNKEQIIKLIGDLDLENNQLSLIPNGETAS